MLDDKLWEILEDIQYSEISEMNKLHYLDVGFAEDTVLYELVPVEIGRLRKAATQDIAEFLWEKEIRTLVMDSAQPHIINDLRLRLKLGKILKTLRLPSKRKDGDY